MRVIRDIEPEVVDALTAQERVILSHLRDEFPLTVDPADLMIAIKSGGMNAVRAYTSRVRAKLDRFESEWRIETVLGSGYRLVRDSRP